MQSDAHKLSSDEIRSIIQPGVSISTFWVPTGASRQWTNDASGKFTAYRRGGSGNTRSNGAGEWSFNDKGEYCVSIDWKTMRNVPDFTEKWCRALYRRDSNLYFAPGDLKGKETSLFPIVTFGK